MTKAAAGSKLIVQSHEARSGDTLVRRAAVVWSPGMDQTLHI